MRLRAPITPKLDDVSAEAVRRAHESAILDLQRLPSAQLRVLKDVSLADGIATPIPHGLGRVPQWVGISAVRGAASAGYINEKRDGTQNRHQFVVLQADDFGATVTVDLVVL